MKLHNHIAAIIRNSQKEESCFYFGTQFGVFFIGLFLLNAMDGWFDADLSPLGLKQSVELGERRRNGGYVAVFCADQQRAYKSATIAFADTNIPIIVDSRLRECNYGDYNAGEKKFVDGQRTERINTPYPNGESYMQTKDRMFAFLEYLKQNYDGKKVLIVGARATQFGIQNYIEGTSYEELVVAKFTWQPGWEYEI